MEGTGEPTLDRIAGAIGRAQPRQAGMSAEGLRTGAELFAPPVSIEGVTGLGSTDVQFFQSMFDMRNVFRVMFELVSTFNQSSTVQVIGAAFNAPRTTTSHYTIGVPQGLAANDILAIHINLGDLYFPWIGFRVTPLTSPTAGEVVASAHAQLLSQ